MKAFTQIVRKYYKYVSWTQPVFTSETTWGNVWADNYYNGQNPWHALDGKTSGGNEADFASSSASEVNWYWNFVFPLKITAIKIWNRNNAQNYGGATTYTIYGKNQDESYEQIGTLSLAATSWVSDTISITSTKRYRGLKIYCSGSKNYVGIGEILLTAYQSTSGTLSDYDYYEDVDIYKLHTETIRTYYNSFTFYPSSFFQEYTVPSGITSIHVDCIAGSGFGADATHNGRGGRVECDLSVTPGQKLYVMVGKKSSATAISNAGTAEYNASDIRTNGNGVTDSTSLQSRLVVAGGGGNAGGNGNNINGYGGNGGGLIGGDGSGGSTYNNPGKGGTQTAGGAGGSGGMYGGSGKQGTFGLGGNGDTAYESGAGGAGWYGGGGSGKYVYYAGVGSGGGGGSSYTDPDLCSNVAHTQGYQVGDGYITITGTNVYYEDVTTYKAFNV